MAFLHENREAFEDAVNHTRDVTGFTSVIIEKDYYVTMILKGLSERLPFIVFKGGTSLSKCHGVIKRFSEDIDVTIDVQKLTQGMKKKIKMSIEEVAAELKLTIPNVEDTRSRRNLNRYVIEYASVLEDMDQGVAPNVLLETSYAEYSFPTVKLPVHSYIGDMLAKEAPEMLMELGLNPYEMKVQAIERTMIDKVFAICDYYMKGDIKRNSRHIYDIYKLLQIVPQNEEFSELVKEVRRVRAENKTICLSAQLGVNVAEILKSIVDNDIYKADYEDLTSNILQEDVTYETAIRAVEEVARSGIF